MRRLALSAQLLAGRNRQLGIAPWAALVHKLSSALDFGSAHTAADMVGLGAGDFLRSGMPYWALCAAGWRIVSGGFAVGDS
jgi:hypothetical protein